MIKYYKKLLLTSLILFAGQAFAINLEGVYQQALKSDPTFQVAKEQWLSDRQNVPIARSGLLPVFDIKAGLSHQTIDNRYQSLQDIGYANDESKYSLILSQTIFNYQTWSLLYKEKAAVKGSTARYAASGLNLIYRTVSGYLQILQAADVLRFTEANKKSLAGQLEQTKQKLSVGLATITELHQAQASYDRVVADELSNKNDLAVKKEQLAEITGIVYDSYQGLSTKMPLIYPSPNDIEKWVTWAMRQNYDLRASQYDLEAARENIKQQRAGHFPTLTANGEFDYTYDNAGIGLTGDANLSTREGARNRFGTVGLSLDFPVMQGGQVVAQTIQAEHDYEKAYATLEQTNRSVVSKTRQGYLSVISGIGVVIAKKAAVVSAQSSYESTLASYQVGMNTMIDVLNEETKLYAAQKDYAVSQYDYIIQTLNLKQAAGTLSVADVRTINSWLSSTNIIDGSSPATSHKSVSASVQPLPQHLQKTTTKPLPSPQQAVRKVQATNSSLQTVMSANPSHYTIQFRAAKTEAELQSFIKKYTWFAPYYFVPTISKGQSWYVLVTGDYSTLQNAQQSLNMVKFVGQDRPWIRSYSSLQKAYRR